MDIVFCCWLTLGQTSLTINTHVILIKTEYIDVTHISLTSTNSCTHRVNPSRVLIGWSACVKTVLIRDLCQIIFPTSFFSDWHCRQTLYKLRWLLRSKALGGKLNPQGPLQTRCVPQSSHTYTLFSLATFCDIFALFLPHRAQDGN